MKILDGYYWNFIIRSDVITMLFLLFKSVAIGFLLLDVYKHFMKYSFTDEELIWFEY